MSDAAGTLANLAPTVAATQHAGAAWMLLAAVFAPAAAGLLTMALPSRPTAPKVLLALAGPVVSLVLLGLYLGEHGTTLGRVVLPWMPELELDLAFHADALGAFFALLVAGIGTLIILYGRAYLGNDPADIAKFYPLITVFMTAMLGLVLADDFLLMLLFWELTSVSSFLLIGWDYTNKQGVKNALQAFATTGFGGLALLGGLAWLGVASGGAWSFTELAALPPVGGAAVVAAFCLVYAGIAAKSAQWPLHYWLPGAMLAPTPISAYLHSAAMVKAGIYLLARLWPSLAHLQTWPWLVVTIGGITMVLGAWIALQRDVLKQILAYTTISQLGLLACAFGLAHLAYHHEPNVVWGNAQILNHALYKAALFMLAGGVTHAMGIKALSGLRGAWHAGGERRWYAFLFLLAMIALAALPGTFSFFAKEAFLYQIWHGYEATESPWLLALLVAAVFVSICNVAILVRFAQTFFAREVVGEPCPPHQDAAGEPHPHERDTFFWHTMLWLPAALLIGLQYFGGIAGTTFAGWIEPYEATPHYLDVKSFSLLYVVTHPSVPLLASGIGIVLGVLLGVSPVWHGYRGDWHDRIFPSAYLGILVGGGLAFGALQTGRMRWYMWATLAVGAAVLAYVATAGSGLMAVLHLPLEAWNQARAMPGGQLPSFFAEPAAWLLCGLVVAGALAMTFIRDRAGRVLILGATGFGVTGVFYYYAAPDLALTQLSVEIVSLVLFLLVLNLLPDESPGDRTWVGSRLVVALAIGATATAVTLLASAGPRPSRPIVLADGTVPATLGDYFLRNSYEGVDTAHVDPDSVGLGVVDRGEKHLKSFGSKPHYGGGHAGAYVAAAPKEGTADLADEAMTLHKGGGGANVVNVILVDFRGFDTLGEVTVLGLAAMGVWTLLRKPPSRADTEETDNRSEPQDDTFIDPYHPLSRAMPARPRGTRAVRSEAIASPIVKTAAKLLVPTAVVFAAYLFFKGHQSPGGGFVGGLATSVALVVYRMCFGCDALYRLLPVRERVLIGVGLLLAVATAAAPLLFGLPLLTSNNGYLPLPGNASFHWATVMVFDLGVFLIVVGSVVGMIDALARELE